MSLTKLLLHLIFNFFDTYGYFRDELYYLACSNHLAGGYVDHPPFAVYLLKVNTLLLGSSLFAVRLLPAVAGAATIFFTGLIAKNLGGKSFAQFLSCLCAFSLSVFAMDGFYSMNCFDILIWAIVGYVITQIIKTGEQKLWIYLGVILGIGLLNKIGVLFLGAGLFVGIIFTSQRQWLKTIWPYVTAAIAGVLFLPYIIWNITHDFAHLEFIHNAAEKYASQNPINFLKQQLLINNPVAILVWLPGLFALFFSVSLKQFRLLGYLYLVPLFIFLLNGTSKPEYLLPAYGVLWAAGGVMVEKFADAIKFGKVIKVVLPSLIATLIIIFMPFVVPILPVETYIRYAKALGMEPSSAENKELSELPQFYADRFGWEDKANAVAKVYNSLSTKDKEVCSIYSNNYGRCGAIDLFGKKYGLPPTIGNHNNYWIWGSRNATGEVMIILGSNEEDLKQRFEEVKEVSRVTTKYCMPYENNVPIFLCRRIKFSLKEIWPAIKSYN